MTNKEVVQEWFKKVWHEGDTRTIHKMFESSGKAAGLGARPIAGPTEFEAFQKAMFGLIENVKISIDQSFESGEWIAVFCTLEAKKRGSDKKIVMPGSCSLRIKDDVILEAYNHWEFMAFFEQLDLLPKDSFATCLQGKPISSATSKQ